LNLLYKFKLFFFLYGKNFPTLLYHKIKGKSLVREWGVLLSGEGCRGMDGWMDDRQTDQS